jgi:hypothetical protein
MMMTILSLKHAAAWRLVAVVLGVLTSTAAVAEAVMSGTMKPLGSVRFAPDNDVPCLLSALETGDPATGPSTWILKAPAGCVVPWHSHTAGEQLMIIRGAVLAEMTDHPATRLGPGGFAAMGGRMPHQFTCVRKATCIMMITFDGRYDIRWGKGG